MEKIELKDIKVRDWLLVINKKNKEQKWVFEIQNISQDNLTSKEYKMFEEFEAGGPEESNSKNWDFTNWGWYKLNKEEIKKWKKIILLKAL